MALSQGTKQLIDKWLKDHCPSFKCTACNGTKLDIDEVVVCAPKTAPKGLLMGKGPTTEFVPLVCLNCGFVMFFSVKLLGLTV
jgi:hypothetical protein